jgi:capsular polysaccharide biosynthesis protein
MIPEEIDLRSLLKLIYAKKKIIIFGTLACIILAGTFSFIIPKVYESSLILQVGTIYLSSNAWKQEMQFIEEPEATAKIMTGIGIMEKARQQLNLDLTPKQIKKSLEVTTFIEANEYLPILEVAYEASSPLETVAFLNALAGTVIDRHSRKNGAYRQGMEGKIKYNREKIVAFEKIISAQTRYRDLSQKYIDRGEISSEEFMKELGEVEFSSPSAVDMLYLQGSALTEKQHITELTQFKAELDMRIGQNQKEKADAEMEIVNLQSRLDLSSSTMIISPPVPIERPVKPNKPLIIIIAAVIGFALMILIVSGREYLRD